MASDARDAQSTVSKMLSAVFFAYIVHIKMYMYVRYR
jgi:hypothetical protein